MSGATAEAAETPGAHSRLARLARDPLVALLALGVLSRVALVLVAALAGSYFPGAEQGWNRGPGFVRYFARWDSGFYMDIAELGYGFKPEAWAFNPGYPAVVGLVWRAVPLVDLPTAGFLVSNAAFLASMAMLYRLTRPWMGERVAWRACVFLAVFPGSFYLSAVYADSLFLALVLGALLAVQARRWALAGLVVSFAAITRPPGLFLVGALGLAALVACRRARRVDWRAAASVPLALLLPAAFAGYSWLAAGDPFVSTSAREAYWPNVQWHSPLTLFDLSGVEAPIKAVVFAGMALLVAAMAFSAWDLVRSRDLDRLPAHAFTLVMGVVYLSYSEPNPIVRYLVTLPSVYWMLASVSGWRGAMAGLVAVCAALAAFVAAVFATWGPLY